MPLTIPPYEGQGWTDNSTPDLSAETLNAVDDGIAAVTNGVNAIAAAVVSQIINDPEKIASIAVAYAQQQQINTINTKLSYQPGDVINLALFVAGGFLTTSGTEIVFTISLPKILDISRAITNNIAGLDVRQNGGYLRRTSDGINGLVFIFERNSIGLTARITKSDGWGGTNNDVVAVYLTGSLTIQ